jgi:hypothetical protein
MMHTRQYTTFTARITIRQRNEKKVDGGRPRQKKVTGRFPDLFTAAAGAIYLFFHQHAGPVFKFSATRAARQRVLLCVHRCCRCRNLYSRAGVS